MDPKLARTRMIDRLIQSNCSPIAVGKRPSEGQGVDSGEVNWGGMDDAKIAGLLSAETSREESVTSLDTGEQIVEQLYGQLGVTVNVIPGYPGNQCHGRLDVVVGKNDSLETRILQAIEHLAIQNLFQY